MSDNKRPVIIVTGASRGIGLAVARILLLQFDAIVVALSRSNPPELSDLLSKFSSRLLVIQTDLTSTPALQSSISTVIKTFQRIDGLVLNAGVLGPITNVSSPNYSISDWKQCFDLNFFSLLETIHLTAPYLTVSNGRIIFVSSGAAVGGTAGWGAYNTTKAAVNSLCRTIASEEPHITSVSIAPGMVDTDMQTKIREIGPGAMASGDLKRFSDAHAHGLLVKPADSGHVIASLVLNAPRSMNGTFVRWDGEECRPFRKDGAKS